MAEDEKPLTSVIMVTYHTGPVLDQAIRHVLAQSTAIELCLVDNGNTPEVLSGLQKMAGSEPRLTVITGHGNIGFSRACNKGAHAAKGDFLLFLNPDSLLPSKAVELLLRHEASLRRPYMIGARLLDEDGKDQRGCRRALLTPGTAFVEALHLGALFPKVRLNFNEDSVPEKITPMPAISGAFMFMPRQDFWRIEGFDEGYFLHVEDLDLCLRFRRAGGEIYFLPDLVVTHVGGTSKATKAFIERHKARGFIRYFHNNFPDFPKPLLWLLDMAIWARTTLRIATAGSNT